MTFSKVWTARAAAMKSHQVWKALKITKWLNIWHGELTKRRCLLCCLLLWNKSPLWYRTDYSKFGSMRVDAHSRDATILKETALESQVFANFFVIQCFSVFSRIQRDSFGDVMANATISTLTNYSDLWPLIAFLQIKHEFSNIVMSAFIENFLNTL